MKNVVLLIVLPIFVIVSIAWANFEEVTPTGDILKKKVDTQLFNKIDVSGGFEVVFTQGKQDVVIEAYENMFEYLKVEVKGKTLKIGFAKNNLNINGNHKIKVYVSAKDLESVVTSGGVIFTINDELKGSRISFTGSGGINFSGKIRCEEFKATLSGGCNVNLNLDCINANLTGSGGCNISVKGKADDCRISGSGGVNVYAENFIVEKSKLSLSGGCNARVHVNREMSYHLSGSARLYYKGNPVIKASNSSKDTRLEKIS